jgi:hypothetical protein
VSKDRAKGRPPTSPPPIVMRHLLGGALIALTKAERVGEGTPTARRLGSSLLGSPGPAGGPWVWLAARCTAQSAR